LSGSYLKPPALPEVVTQKKFKLMEINIPKRNEQKEIVSQVESLFTLADTLEKNRSCKKMSR